MTEIKKIGNILRIKTKNQDIAVVKKGGKYICLEVQQVKNSDFKESDHPRDKDGKFTAKGGGESGSAKEEKTVEKVEIVEGYEKRVSPQRFHNKIKEAKESVSADSRWRVDVHEANDYTKDKLFVSEGGSTVAVTSDGDIISVCRKDGDKIRGSDLLKKAVSSGGKKLDAFSGLFEFYAKNGFEPVSWCKFDEKYAPDGWDKLRDDKEEVIFWKYTGEKYTGSKENFLKNTKASKGYEEAMSIRDKNLEK